MASKRTLRPRIFRLGTFEYRLDLRGSKYAGLLGVVSGGKKSLQFSSHAEAERKADEIQSMLEKHGAQRLESVSRMLDEDLSALHNKLAPFNRTLTDAVDFYVSHLATQQEREKSETLAALVDCWLAEKKSELEKGTLRQRTFETLRLYGNRFKGQWGTRKVGTITHHEIKSWLDSLTVPLSENAVSHISSTYEQHHRSYLSQFFIWCRRKYQTPRDNPCDAIQIKSVSADPEYLTVEECEVLLKKCLTAHSIDLLPYHVICLFAGVRPKECERLHWDDIDFEDCSLVLLKGHAKTGNARRIEILPLLKTWLMWYRTNHPTTELIPPDFTRKLKSFRKALGGWQHNVMRHSFASYYLSGIKKDFGALEASMGNSRVMLQKHYVQFPSRGEANKFWNLTPETILSQDPAAESNTAPLTP